MIQNLALVHQIKPGMQNQNIPIELLLGTQIDKQKKKKKTLGFHSFQRSDGQKKNDERWLLAEMPTKIFKNSRSVWWTRAL